VGQKLVLHFFEQMPILGDEVVVQINGPAHCRIMHCVTYVVNDIICGSRKCT
jgi:hypothetical protein